MRVKAAFESTRCFIPPEVSSEHSSSLYTAHPTCYWRANLYVGRRGFSSAKYCVTWLGGNKLLVTLPSVGSDEVDEQRNMDGNGRFLRSFTLVKYERCKYSLDKGKNSLVSYGRKQYSMIKLVIQQCCTDAYIFSCSSLSYSSWKSLVPRIKSPQIFRLQTLKFIC